MIRKTEHGCELVSIRLARVSKKTSKGDSISFVGIQDNNSIHNEILCSLTTKQAEFYVNTVAFEADKVCCWLMTRVPEIFPSLPIL